MKYTACLQTIVPVFCSLLSVTSHAALVTSVPGPDDQGGMVMPMVTIEATSGTGTNPTAGIVHVTQPTDSPLTLRSLEQWWPGSWFAETAAWRQNLSSPAGVGSTPAANAGAGDLFNNQYGFMYMGMGMPNMAFVPDGMSLAIRLNSISSPDMRSFNYGQSNNRWDEVFTSGPAENQVLWNGSMWHNYFTLPADAQPGEYTAEFEVFIANTPFTGNTGFAQYDQAAFDALKNENFKSGFVTYKWNIIPEPSGALLCSIGLLMCALYKRR